ncbi:MAG: NAD(P)H-dependent oxidoreductase [Bdellovibrionota bacterium]
MSNIVIVAGSNNKNLSLAKEFEKHFAAHSIKSQIVDLVSLEIPLYTPVEESRGIPEKVFKYIDIFDQAKGFVFAVPEYNGGVPPVVTSMIAWISRSGNSDWRKCFNAKPAALASFSGVVGFQALISLRTQLSYIGLNVIGRQVRATHKDDLDIESLKAVANLLIKAL